MTVVVLPTLIYVDELHIIWSKPRLRNPHLSSSFNLQVSGNLDFSLDPVLSKTIYRVFPCDETSPLHLLIL